MRDGSAERSWTRAVGTDVPPPYENALVVEFGLRGIAYEQQARFNVVYKRVKVGEYIPDLIMFAKVVVKVIDETTKHEMGQIINYLKIKKYRAQGWVDSQLQQSRTGMETDRPLSRMDEQQYLQIIPCQY